MFSNFFPISGRRPEIPVLAGGQGPNDRNGRCIAILFRSIGVRGRRLTPEVRGQEFLWALAGPPHHQTSLENPNLLK